METKDLESLIDKVNNAIELIENIDLYNYGTPTIRTYNQKKLIKTYDILFKTRNHLKYLLKKAGGLNEEEL